MVRLHRITHNQQSPRSLAVVLASVQQAGKCAMRSQSHSFCLTTHHESQIESFVFSLLFSTLPDWAKIKNFDWFGLIFREKITDFDFDFGIPKKNHQYRYYKLKLKLKSEQKLDYSIIIIQFVTRFWHRLSAWWFFSDSRLYCVK